ncbi:MAG TPA: hypothetical protein DDY43_03790 [Synechococcales bacterium UBA10510]|nr:hypothetical protein [Synechococcales bacterium UBA10510]
MRSPRRSGSRDGFDQWLAQLEQVCSVTELERRQFLVASSIKPWRGWGITGANSILPFSRE